MLLRRTEARRLNLSPCVEVPEVSDEQDSSPWAFATVPRARIGVAEGVISRRSARVRLLMPYSPVVAGLVPEGRSKREAERQSLGPSFYGTARLSPDLLVLSSGDGSVCDHAERVVRSGMAAAAVTLAGAECHIKRNF